VRINNQTAAKYLLGLTVLLFLFFPALDLIRPFHIGLLPLILLLIIKPMSVFNLIVVFILIFVSFLSLLVTFEDVRIPTIGFIWSALPLCFVFIGFSYAKSLNFTVIEIKVFSYVLAVVGVFFVLVQIIYPSSSIMEPYLALTSHSSVLDRYTMIIAPTGNPNMTGLLLALIIVLVSLYLRVSEHTSQNFFLKIMIFILLVGIIFCFARTVLAAVLIFLFVLLFLQYSKKITQLFISIAAFSFVLVAFFYLRDSNERFITYFSTIFAFYDDNSFVARFENWFLTLELIQDYPLSILFGLSQYEALFFSLKGTSVVDSNYLYIFLNHGFIILLILVGVCVFKSLKNSFYFSLLVFLLITSITIPYLSDYRIGFFIGFIYGVAQNLLSKNSLIQKNEHEHIANRRGIKSIQDESI